MYILQRSLKQIDQKKDRYIDIDKDIDIGIYREINLEIQIDRVR